MSVDSRYVVNGFDMGHIRNLNEIRVAETIRKLVPETKNFCGCQLCLEDIFSLSLNQLPSHYVQAGAIVLGKKTPPDKELKKVVTRAVKAVKKSPNHS